MKQFLRTEWNSGEVREEYRVNAALHRIDGPAVVIRRLDGSCREEYWCNGVPHRDAAPALLDRDASGLTHEEYYHAGKLDRSDGPAVSERWPDGKVVYEAYWQEGKRHRDDGPALIKRSRDGTQLEREENWRNGLKVRSLTERSWLQDILLMLQGKSGWGRGA